MLRFYNTATQKKEVFTTHQSGNVNMYVCGVTVYDHCHLGHARAAIVFDVLYRYLLQKGYRVTYVRNYTDVDDKIIKRAIERNTTWDVIAQTYIDSFEDDMAMLAVAKPTVEPKASQSIPQIISLIQTLIDKGAAYAAGGDVFYAVQTFPTYGALAKKNIDDLRSGARVEVNEAKRDPLDFALWKAAKPGEPSWPSPWGEGRPGWHIECSAMALQALGECVDIHGGGRDLMFPHHENEIAQSEAATGHRFVRYWLHNGIVTLGKEKMSKSTGNFETIKDLLKRADFEVLRLLVLTVHYRSPLDFSDKKLDDATLALTRYYQTIERLAESGCGEVSTPELGKAVRELAERYAAAMNDDLNTAQVIGALFEWVSLVNKELDRAKKPVLSADDAFLLDKTLKQIAQVLGVFDPESAFLDRVQARALKKSALTLDQIEALLDERRIARLEKNWARADEVRKTLADQGIEIKDRPDGTTAWVAK